MSAPAEGIPPEQGSSTYQAEKVKRAGKKNEERRRVAEAEIQRLLLRAVAVADAFCASTVGGYVEELQEDYEAQSIVPDADSTKLCRLQLESAKVRAFQSCATVRSLTLLRIGALSSTSTPKSASSQAALSGA